MIKYILYTLSFFPVWGLLLLSIDKPGQLGIFLCLLYTFYSCVLIKNVVKEETQGLRIVKFIGPTVYLIAFAFTGKIDLNFLLNPVLAGFVVFAISSFINEKIPSVVSQAAMAFFCYLYAFSIYPMWNTVAEDPSEKYDFSIGVALEESQDTSINLKDFIFLNANRDTFSLTANDKFVILESWNESCAPCIKAMKDLPPYYKQIADAADQFYLYEYDQKKVKVDFDKVFDFKLIEEKHKILVDIESNLYSKYELSGYPYFLIFDKKGKLVFKHLGYGLAYQSALQDSISVYVQ
ncbi:MAG: hypothetical protein IPL23_04710 [Saprospiraceae bacterium]|nr:hypothetical protein [Saprospiraceae bacterium]